MSKIGIATVYTGYNYGSALQAYATKCILFEMGYDAELLKLSGSLLPGRDVRFKKLFTVIFRSLFHLNGLKSLKNYKESISKKMPERSVAYFDKFIADSLNPQYVSYGSLKKMAKGEEYAAFICGSDQVWNSSVYYVDPFYYLRFAPATKRVAFAPSFGRDFVPDYNRKKITKFVSEIKNLSVRESSGVDIIKDLTGRGAELLLDPTLVLSAEEWIRVLDLKDVANEKYLLAYFLDTPSKKAIDTIYYIRSKYGLKIINLPYLNDRLTTDELGLAGPREFVNFIKNAAFVCTDSFHGTAFSLNFNIPFYTFERNYGNAAKQSARIESILKLVSQTERYEPSNVDDCMNISFENVNAFLESERSKARRYLDEALCNGEKYE